MVTSMNLKSIVILALLSAPCAAQSEVYKHVDKDGNVTYSSTRQKDAKKLELPPLTVVPPTKVQKESGAVADNAARRKNLEEKIAAEEKLLAQARQALKEGEEDPEISRISRTIKNKDGTSKVVTETHRNVAEYEEKIKKLKEPVITHEKNIEALKKELAGLPTL